MMKKKEGLQPHETFSFKACHHLLPVICISSSYEACLSIPYINNLDIT